MADFYFLEGRESKLMEPEFLDITTSDGHVLRIFYEMSIGDLVVGSLLLILLVFLVLNSIVRIIWR